jgi:hypothetical protein
MRSIDSHQAIIPDEILYIGKMEITLTANVIQYGRQWLLGYIYRNRFIQYALGIATVNDKV